MAKIKRIGNNLAVTSKLMMPEINGRVEVLKKAWSNDWASSSKNEEVNKKIFMNNSLLVEEVRKHLLMLN